VSSALAYYGAALRRAARGDTGEMRLIDPAGHRPAVALSARQWCALRPGDAALLGRCYGTTLDVGCGPGRLTAALTARSIPALGIDVSSEAVRQTRRRGAPAQLACVLTTELALRAWQHVLLVDGNIGIGGDPGRLLKRCRALVRPGGDVLVEVDPPGTGSWSGLVSLGYRDSVSTPFEWAGIAADDLAVLADRLAMNVLETWTEADRWFARLAPE
jgi:SAM-dependent methyltransferase